MPSPPLSRPGRREPSIRVRLLVVAFTGLLGTAAVAGVALEGQNEVRAASRLADDLAAAQTANAQTGSQAAALRSELSDRLGGAGAAQPDPQRVADAEEANQQLTGYADQVARITSGTALAEPALTLRDQQLRYGRVIVSVLTTLQDVDPNAPLPPDVVRSLARELEVRTAMVSDQAVLTQTLAAAQSAADAHRRSTEHRTASYVLLGAGLTGLLLLGLSLLAMRSILRTLQRLRAVTVAVAEGDLRARWGGTGTDEVAQLGAAVDTMAETLGQMLVQLEEEARRDGFARRLTHALDMADDEPASYEVVGRALHQVLPDAPVELLLADSSEAHLERVLATPALTGAGCQVESPFSCVAVRRGTPAVFGDSDDLDACPKLRGRPEGAVSAVCSPVTFMGRALGVLHTTGAVGALPGPEAVEGLTTLAAQTGARIGTLRATRTTELQASTDGLTGLLNRRTLEDRVRRLTSVGTPFAVAMGDLDHFKQLNDRFGHESGDRALRVFAQVLQAHTRGEDLLCRLGGEEFVLVLPHQTGEQARNSIERLRVELSGAVSGGRTPAFTASWGVTDSVQSGELDALLRRCDEALYAAKRAGRDRIVVAEDRPVMAADVLDRATS